MMKTGEPRPEQNAMIDAIDRELKKLDQSVYPSLHALAENELFRLRGGIAESIDLVSNRQVKIRAKIEIPSAQYPGVNFVGKLLGPGGTTLRQTQETTKTKMAILGTGSLRDESKERELLASGDPKFQHLKQRLHLQVDSLAPPSEAYYRLSHALAELRKIMLPESPEFAPPTPYGAATPNWVPPTNPAMMAQRGGVSSMRGGSGGRGGAHRGGFPGASPGNGFRGRGKPWIPRGGAANGTALAYNTPPPQPTPDMYGNGIVQAPTMYPGMNMYEQPDYGTAVYDDFGANYGQDDTWGKVGVTDARGRGRAHPYSRPGMKPETQ